MPELLKHSVGRAQIVYRDISSCFETKEICREQALAGLASSSFSRSSRSSDLRVHQGGSSGCPPCLQLRVRIDPGWPEEQPPKPATIHSHDEASRHDMGIHHDHRAYHCHNTNSKATLQKTPQNNPSTICDEGFTSLSFAAEAPWAAQIQNFLDKSNCRPGVFAQRHPLVQGK